MRAHRLRAHNANAKWALKRQPTELQKQHARHKEPKLYNLSKNRYADASTPRRAIRNTDAPLRLEVGAVRHRAAINAIRLRCLIATHYGLCDSNWENTKSRTPSLKSQRHTIRIQRRTPTLEQHDARSEIRATPIREIGPITPGAASHTHQLRARSDSIGQVQYARWASIPRTRRTTMGYGRKENALKLGRAQITQPGVQFPDHGNQALKIAQVHIQSRESNFTTMAINFIANYRKN